MNTLRILGQIAFVDEDGRQHNLSRPNQRKLLAILACHYGHPVPTAKMLDLLGLSPGGLRTRVRRVRQIIGDDAIVTESTGYRLGDVTVDADLFVRLRSQAKAEQGERRVEILQQAMALWHGDALAEFVHEPWAAGEAARLDELRAATTDDLAELLTTQSRFADATAELELQVAVHPFRDRSRRLLMLALHRGGRTAEALRAYQDYRDFLIEETGTEPPPETVALEASIISGKVAFTADEPISAPLQQQPPAPRGQRSALVTFLCLQIEPNSSPWHHMHELTPEARGRYDEIFVDLTVARAGTLVASSRNGFVAAFNNPIECVEAAVDVQRQLAAAEHIDGSPGVPVRIGVHTGMSFGDDGTYYKPTLDRASAVMEAANALQILLSASTANFIDASSGIECVHRGRHRLVDLPEPIDLFEVVWSESTGELRRLRSVSDIPTNVPAVRSKLIGRADDLALLHEMLTDHRLVTLIGPGGAGKSALAIELAAAHMCDYAEGVFVAELASVTETDQVAETIASAIELRSDSGRHTPKSLAGALRDRPMLVVIDNAEHVLDAVADVVDEIMRLEGPSIVVTSREWLDVPGERTFHVPALEGIAASGNSFGAELFLANTASAGVSISPDEMPAIEALCARLDHLPLALELAAGTAIHLPPAEIVASLDRGEALVSNRRRHRTRRFTTLEQMIGRSYDLLDEREQSLLLTLGAFRGPMTLDAIAGVWASPFERQTSSLLGSLVSRSMVVAKSSKGSVRYHLLETIRDFVRDRAAESGDLEAMQRRHRDWFLQWSRTTSPLELYGSSRRALRLDNQLANFREAMRFSQRSGEVAAVAEQARLLSSVWYTFLRGEEGAEWLASSQVGVADDAELLAHLTSRMSCAFASGNWAGIGALIDDMRTLSAHIESPLSPLALAMVGLTSFHTPAVGEAFLEQARERDAALHTGLRPLIEHLAGDFYIEMGDYQRAAKHYRLATAELQPEEFAWWVSASLVGSAIALHGTGSTAEALPLAEQSLRIASSMPESLGGITRSVGVVAVLQSALGEHEQAAAQLLAEMARNERHTRAASVRFEPLVAVLHVLFDLGANELGVQLLKLATEKELMNQSPWQSALLRLGAARPEAAGWKGASTISIDDALAQSTIILQ